MPELDATQHEQRQPKTSSCEEDCPLPLPATFQEEDNNNEEQYADEDYTDEEEELGEAEAKDILCHFFHASYRPASTRFLASQYVESHRAIMTTMLQGEDATMATMSHDEMVALFRRPRMERIAGSMIRRIVHLINWNRWHDTPVVTGYVHAKIFQASTPQANACNIGPEAIHNVVVHA